MAAAKRADAVQPTRQLAGATDAIPGLGRVEQLVLRGDGLTTTSIEILVGSSVSVRVVRHGRLAVGDISHQQGEDVYTGLEPPDWAMSNTVAQNDLYASDGEQLLVRDVVLVADGIAYAAANLVAVAHLLPDPVAQALARTDEPIGKLLARSGVTTRRALRRWGHREAGSFATLLGPPVESSSSVLARTYTMLLPPTDQPLAAITEYFHPRLFEVTPETADRPST